jgi:hypothetical protein
MNDLPEIAAIALAVSAVLLVLGRWLTGPPSARALLQEIGRARRGEVMGNRLIGTRRAVFRHGAGWGQVVVRRIGWLGRGIHGWLSLPWPHSQAVGPLVIARRQPAQWQSSVSTDRPAAPGPALGVGTFGDAVERLQALCTSAGLHHVTIDCRDGNCYCDLAGSVAHPRQLALWVDAVAHVCNELDLASNPSIRFEPAARPLLTSGQGCPVCGAPVHAPAVRCRGCGTAHHHDCWQYTGRCAVYGCRSTASIEFAASQDTAAG